jgi:hypothetical protein
LAYELGKPKPKTENHRDNAQRRLRHNMGCNAIAKAAASNTKNFWCRNL